MFQHDLVWDTQRHRPRVSKSRKLFGIKRNVMTYLCLLSQYFTNTILPISIIQYSRLTYSSLVCGGFTFKQSPATFRYRGPIKGDPLSVNNYLKNHFGAKKSFI